MCERGVKKHLIFAKMNEKCIAGIHVEFIIRNCTVLYCKTIQGQESLQRERWPLEPRKAVNVNVLLLLS